MTEDEKRMKEQGARLKAARKASGFRSAAAAANENGWAESTYRAHEAGTRTIGLDDAERYAARFGTTSRQILFPEGDAEQPSPPRPVMEAAVGPDFPSRRGPRDIPVLGIAVAGRDEDDDDRIPDFWLSGEVVNYVARPPGLAGAKNIISLHVDGTSMYPRYRERDLVLIQQTAPAPGDDVVIELKPREDGGNHPTFIKEFVRRAGSHIVVKQFNPPREMEFSIKEIMRLFRVIPTKELFG